jgi:dienelactone hydrolase
MEDTKMDFTSDKFLEQMYEKNTIQYRFNANNIEDWEKWRHELKKAFIDDLGGFPESKTELAPQLLEEKEYEDYIRQRIAYTTDENMIVPAYVLIPKNVKGRLQAVIACHGHGYGSRDIVGLNLDGTEKQGDLGYQKNFAVELVKKGMLVIAPELFGFGDRRLAEDNDKPLEQSSCHRLTANLMMHGKTTAGVRIYDIIRTIDYLCTRKDVDSNRIGCMGISGGGLVCAFSSAIDERIKAAVVSGYSNTFRDSVMAMHHCIDNFIPGILKHGEMPDIIGLIAPRPLLMEAGDVDNIFPIASSKKAYCQLQEIYTLLDAKDNLRMDIFEGDHQISGKMAYDLLKEWL